MDYILGIDQAIWHAAGTVRCHLVYNHPDDSRHPGRRRLYFWWDSTRNE